MKRSLFLVLLFAALSLTVGGTWSAAFGQDRTSPSQTSPPSNPSQPADQPRYEQNQTNSTQPATNNSPRTSTSTEPYETCLLYTSDAADERSSVDLGGRR